MNIDYVMCNKVDFGDVCKYGDISLVKELIKMGEVYEQQYYNGIDGACEGGHTDIFYFLYGLVDVSYGIFFDVCKSGCLELIKYTMERVELCDWNWNIVLYGLCIGGHIKNIEDILKTTRCAWNWNLGLEGACRGGHSDIAELMISSGADNLGSGLKYACIEGHINIALLMMSKGATDHSIGLINACSRGYMDIVQLMLSKGADDYNFSLECAYENGHSDIAELMISKGAIFYSGTFSFPYRNKKTKFFHIDIYTDEYKEFMKHSILYWTIIYGHRHRKVVQKDLIPDLLKLLYF